MTRTPYIDDPRDLLEAAGVLNEQDGIPDTLPPVEDLDVLTNVEDSIANQLKIIENAIGIPVRAVPNTVNELYKAFPKGLITVHYLRSEFPALASSAMRRPVQNERALFVITISALNLRTHTSVYKIIWAARVMLLGFRPKHAIGGMQLTGQEFVRIDPKHRLWEYRMTFAVPMQAISQGYEQSAVLLRHLQVLDKDGQLFLSLGENDESVNE